MATTPVWGRHYPATGDTPDIPRDILALATDLESCPPATSGTLALRPVSSVGAPGKQGRRYLATDQGTHGIEYLDYGTGWLTIGPVAAGAIGTTELANGAVTSAKLDPAVANRFPQLSAPAARAMDFSLDTGDARCKIHFDGTGSTATGWYPHLLPITPKVMLATKILHAGALYLEVGEISVFNHDVSGIIWSASSHSGGNLAGDVYFSWLALA